MMSASHQQKEVPADPDSLFDICKRYIGLHLDYIESLIGFPDIIGRQIFEASVISNRCTPLTLRTQSSARECLKIFFDAYGHCDILESLCLSRSHLFLSDVIDSSWWLVEYLVHLDLSSCGLGDSHDILSSLPTCTRLKTLVLKDNSLTDEGIRKLTARSRMFGNFFSALSCLDLSENAGLTVKSLAFLKCLSNLELLDLSRTNISTDQVNKFSTWRVYTTPDVCDCIKSRFVITTKGWATDVIEGWKREYDTAKSSLSESTLSSTSGQTTKALTAKSFYSRRRPTFVSSLLDSEEVQYRTNSTPILLVSSQFSCSEAGVTSMTYLQSPYTVASQLKSCCKSLKKYNGTCNEVHFSTMYEKDENYSAKRGRLKFSSKKMEDICQQLHHDINETRDHSNKKTVVTDRSTGLYPGTRKLNAMHKAAVCSVQRDYGSLQPYQCLNQSKPEERDSQRKHDTEAWLLAQYQSSTSPQKKKKKRLSLLQQLEES